MAIRDEVDKTIDNVKDAAHEIKHRAVADAERTKRDLDGDDMTTSEKIGSVVNQKKNEAQATIDKAKRDLRNKS